MRFLTILVVAIASLNGFYAEDDMSDTDLYLRIIECAQHGVIYGIPEIGLPSHNPLIIPRNYSTSGTLANYNFDIALENMYMEGIPWWNVTQMDDLSEIKGISVFDYAIYWKLISFVGTLRVAVSDTETETKLYEQEAEMGFEFDHITFSGQFNFTKFYEETAAGFNDLTLGFNAEDSELHIDGLGILSSIIKLVGGPLLKELINSDMAAEQAGPLIKDKLNNDWVGKPERIQALITYCDSNSF